jgi:hypothetical protein
MTPDKHVLLIFFFKNASISLFFLFIEFIFQIVNLTMHIENTTYSMYVIYIIFSCATFIYISYICTCSSILQSLISTIKIASSMTLGHKYFIWYIFPFHIRYVFSKSTNFILNVCKWWPNEQVQHYDSNWNNKTMWLIIITHIFIVFFNLKGIDS